MKFDYEEFVTFRGEVKDRAQGHVPPLAILYAIFSVADGLEHAVVFAERSGDPVMWSVTALTGTSLITANFAGGDDADDGDVECHAFPRSQVSRVSVSKVKDARAASPMATAAHTVHMEDGTVLHLPRAAAPHARPEGHGGGSQSRSTHRMSSGLMVRDDPRGTYLTGPTSHS